MKSVGMRERKCRGNERVMRSDATARGREQAVGRDGGEGIYTGRGIDSVQCGGTVQYEWQVYV